VRELGKRKKKGDRGVAEVVSRIRTERKAIKKKK